MAAFTPVRAERIEVVLASDRRREHPPELQARLVAEMMRGAGVGDCGARGIYASVLHRCQRPG